MHTSSVGAGCPNQVSKKTVDRENTIVTHGHPMLQARLASKPRIESVPQRVAKRVRAEYHECLIGRARKGRSGVTHSRCHRH